MDVKKAHKLLLGLPLLFTVCFRLYLWTGVEPPYEGYLLVILGLLRLHPLPEYFNGAYRAYP